MATRKMKKVFVNGFAHPPSVLDNRYNGLHLRKVEIQNLVKNRKYLIGKPVFLEHKEDPIGKIVDVAAKSMNTQYGEADALNVTMAITDETPNGGKAIEGIKNGKLNFLSLKTDVNDFNEHSKGHVDKICPIEISIVETPYRESCNITGYTEDGQVFSKSQNNNTFHVYMDSTQAEQAASRLQLDEKEAKRAKIMNDLSSLLSVEEVEDLYSAVDKTKKAEAAFITEQVSKLSDISKIPQEAWTNTDSRVLSFVCSANAKASEMEEAQKKLAEQLKTLEQENQVLSGKLKSTVEATPVQFKNVPKNLPPSTMANIVNEALRKQPDVVPYSTLNLTSKVAGLPLDPLLAAQ